MTKTHSYDIVWQDTDPKLDGTLSIEYQPAGYAATNKSVGIAVLSIDEDPRFETPTDYCEMLYRALYESLYPSLFYGDELPPMLVSAEFNAYNRGEAERSEVVVGDGFV